MRQLLTSKIKAILVAAALLLSAGTVLAAGGGPFISRYVVGGGGSHSGLGPYAMDVTVGQAVVGKFSAAPFELCAGYWCDMSEYKIFLPIVLLD